MQHDLDSGMLDLIITPQKGSQPNLQYQPFSKERIVLIAGNETDTTDLEELFNEGKIKDAADLLKQQLWYSTAADMEHLKISG